MERSETANAGRAKLHRMRPTIGFMVDSLTVHESVLWNGALDAVRSHDANLIGFQGNLLESPDGFAAQANVIYQLASADNVDGLVFSSATMAHWVSLDGMQRFADRYHPLPRVSLGLPLKGIPSLTVDNFQGMRQLINHLIEAHRFRRIAYISGPQEHPESRIRYQAYTDVLAEYGLPLDPALVSPPTTWVESSGRDAIRVLIDERGLRPGVDFDAVAASNDASALGVLIELQARGFRVPEDVAVTGFDGHRSGEYSAPSLTSVRQPIYEQGRLAIEMVLAQLRGEDIPLQKNMPTELVIRQSCGCPDPIVLQGATGPIAELRLKNAAGETPGGTLGTATEHIQAEMINVTRSVFEDLDPAWVRAAAGCLFRRCTGRFNRCIWLGAGRSHPPYGGDQTRSASVAEHHIRASPPCLTPSGRAGASVPGEDLWQQARVIIAEATNRFGGLQEVAGTPAG